MSADSWSHCPNCRPDGDGSNPRQEALEKLSSCYGIIPLKEYGERLAEASKLPDYVDENLREDYEFWLTGKTLNIKYSCVCNDCGFAFEYSNKVSMEKGET